MYIELYSCKFISDPVAMYTYIMSHIYYIYFYIILMIYYIYMCVCVCVCVYIYIYTQTLYSSGIHAYINHIGCYLHFMVPCAYWLPFPFRPRRIAGTILMAVEAAAETNKPSWIYSDRYYAIVGWLVVWNMFYFPIYWE